MFNCWEISPNQVPDTNVVKQRSTQEHCTLKKKNWHNEPDVYTISTKKRVYIMMGKVIVCYCIESEGTDPGRSEVSTGETNEHWYRVPLRGVGA